MTYAEAEQVMSILRPQWPEGTVPRYFGRTPQGQVWGHPIRDIIDLMEVTTRADEIGWNSYIQMNPTRKRYGTRTKGEDITHWSWFLIDIDPIKSPAGWTTDCGRAAEYTTKVVESLLGRPNMKRTVIFSGRGIQFWYPLGPVEADRAVAVHMERPFDSNLDLLTDVPTKVFRVRDLAPRVCGYWLDRLRRKLEDWYDGKPEATIDTSVADLPRVMRLPYTVNQKTGIRSTIIEHIPGTNESLHHRLINYAPYHIFKDPDPPAIPEGFGDGTPWQMFLPHLTVAARIFLTEGASEGGRHRQASAALLSLKELGCGAAQTQEALLWGASLCSPVLESREILPMIQRHFGRST